MTQGSSRGVNWRHAWVVSLLLAALLALPAHALGSADKATPVPPVGAAPTVAKDPAPSDTLGYYVEPFAYRIAPGDQLHVDYGLTLDNKPIEADVVVRPDGVTTLPRIGDVRVVGLTTTDVDSLLAQMYAGIYVNPRITVAIRTVAGNLVHVLGEVKNPGSYQIQPNATALQAIAQAGGFMDDAARGSVLVLRRSAPDVISVRKLNMKSVLSGRASADVMLRRYDIVYVNRSAIGDVSHFVTQIVAPVMAAGDAYFRGWEVLHMDRIFPPGVRVVTSP